MKKSKKKFLTISLTILSIIAIGINSYAHSGRTDAYGGHKDKNNKSRIMKLSLSLWRSSSTFTSKWSMPIFIIIK